MRNKLLPLACGLAFLAVGVYAGILAQNTSDITINALPSPTPVQTPKEVSKTGCLIPYSDTELAAIAKLNASEEKHPYGIVGGVQIERPSWIVTLILQHNDSDCDGVSNARDNCIVVFNPSQRDSNRNGIGDACEPKSHHRVSKLKRKS